MQNFNERIQVIAQTEGLSINEMERIIGASKGVLSRAIKNNTDIQCKWLFAISDNFPKYSPEWLLTGKGDPLNKMEPVFTEHSNYQGMVTGLVQIMREKDEQIIDMAKEIGRLNEQIEQLKKKLQKTASDASMSGTANVG